MKILILIEITSLGGHVISAFTTGKELKKRGHEVHFAAGKGPLANEIKKIFPFHPLTYYHFHGYRETYFTWKSIITLKQLIRVVDKKQFDHIHAFDARSYIIASILGIFKKIPVTCTLCGSLAPNYNMPKSEKIIVFSKEQRDRLVNVFDWKEKNIEVISTRLDMEQFSKVNKEGVDKLYHKYNINLSDKNIMMISNFLAPKVESIKCVLEASHTFLKKHKEVRMIFIGGRGEFFNKAKEIGRKINQQCGREAIIFTGKVINAYRLLISSHIVLGVGRSAFEGIAYRKPTLIVGKKGYAGTVNRENIDQISYYNFSGRNNKTNAPSELLVNEITKLIEDKAYYESVMDFGVDFLIREIDIKSGIANIEKVYEINKSSLQNYKRMFKALDIFKILIPIFVDNYYNHFKSMVIPRLRIVSDKFT